MAVHHLLLLLIQAVLFFTFTSAQDTGTDCGECDKSICPSVDECKFGVDRDICECCNVCLRGLGELCDSPNSPSKLYGTCGDFLECADRLDVKDSKESVCVCKEEGEVCGSDGQTYPSVCHLLQESQNNGELQVKERGACLKAPVIKSRPGDMVRPLGSILVLDCEAEGVPVPEITWSLSKLDGSSYILPGDNPSFAVQVRGGPESNMATGWIQIMKVTEETLGIYTCIATNSEGRTEASASVTKSAEENEV